MADLDNRHKRPVTDKSQSDRLVSLAVSSVANVCYRLIATPISLLRPLTPQLLAFVICILVIPLLVFFSLSAGWVVWRNVAVGWESAVYLQYGDGLPPYADLLLPKLVSDQPYDVSLHLIVPASESNFALGNFMTTLTLTTPSNRTLSSVRRPSIILRPALLRSLFSYRSGTFEYKVPLLSSYAPGTSRITAHIELGRRDNWKSLGNGEGRELSVLKASLRGVVIPAGIRGLVTRFPLIASFAASITFFFVSSFALLICFLPVLRYRLIAPTSAFLPPSSRSNTQFPSKSSLGTSRPSRWRSDDLDDGDGDDDDDDASGKPLRSRRRSRKGSSVGVNRRRLSSGTAIPAEIPIATTSSAPIRRRHSRVKTPPSDD